MQSFKALKSGKTKLVSENEWVSRNPDSLLLFDQATRYEAPPVIKHKGKLYTLYVVNGNCSTNDFQQVMYALAEEDCISEMKTRCSRMGYCSVTQVKPALLKHVNKYRIRNVEIPILYERVICHQ